MCCPCREVQEGNSLGSDSLMQPSSQQGHGGSEPHRGQFSSQACGAHCGVLLTMKCSYVFNHYREGRHACRGNEGLNYLHFQWNFNRIYEIGMKNIYIAFFWSCRTLKLCHLLQLCATKWSLMNSRVFFAISKSKWIVLSPIPCDIYTILYNTIEIMASWYLEHAQLTLIFYIFAHGY